MEAIVDLNNHVNKCRFCLRDFDEEDLQLKITRSIEEKYLNLTQIELKLTDNYSQVICENCNNDLRNFAILRKDLIFKQNSLVALVEGPNDFTVLTEQIDIKYTDKNEEPSSQSPKVKTELISIEFPNFVNAEYLENIDTAADDQLDTGTDEYEQFNAVNLDNLAVVKLNTNFFKTTKSYKRAICGICGNSYLKDQLQRHIDKVHYKVKRFFCDICGFGSFLKCNLRTHMAKHIPKMYRDQIKCDLCESSFTRTESLKNHMKTEHETPVMLTCFCGKEFNLRHKLTTHIKRTHNNVRDHLCNICNKRFFTPKELKVHILKNHTPGYVDKSEHFCEICGKRYSSIKSLKMHMKHHQESQFKCDFEGCNKEFITKLQLAHHVKIHTGQRDFMCHLCEKSFYSANHLRRHILVSHDKIRINCFVAGCRFSVGRKDYMRNHILTHRELTEDVKNMYLVQIRELKL